MIMVLGERVNRSDLHHIVTPDLIRGPPAFVERDPNRNPTTAGRARTLRAVSIYHAVAQDDALPRNGTRLEQL